ncbi:hypothetical protein PSAB6_180087 [Paraburkholderia sabiae]|nr:hypothetical protein PSAB6_180087 [Paraburkholderia sabiae]
MGHVLHGPRDFLRVDQLDADPAERRRPHAEERDADFGAIPARRCRRGVGRRADGPLQRESCDRRLLCADGRERVLHRAGGGQCRRARGDRVHRGRADEHRAIVDARSRGCLLSDGRARHGCRVDARRRTLRRDCRFVPRRRIDASPLHVRGRVRDDCDCRPGRVRRAADQADGEAAGQRRGGGQARIAGTLSSNSLFVKQAFYAPTIFEVVGALLLCLRIRIVKPALSNRFRRTCACRAHLKFRDSLAVSMLERSARQESCTTI